MLAAFQTSFLISHLDFVSVTVIDAEDGRDEFRLSEKTGLAALRLALSQGKLPQRTSSSVPTSTAHCTQQPDDASSLFSGVSAYSTPQQASSADNTSTNSDVHSEGDDNSGNCDDDLQSEEDPTSLSTVSVTAAAAKDTTAAPVAALAPRPAAASSSSASIVETVKSARRKRSYWLPRYVTDLPYDDTMVAEANERTKRVRFEGVLRTTTAQGMTTRSVAMPPAAAMPVEAQPQPLWPVPLSLTKQRLLEHTDAASLAAICSWVTANDFGRSYLQSLLSFLQQPDGERVIYVAASFDFDRILLLKTSGGSTCGRVQEMTVTRAVPLTATQTVQATISLHHTTTEKKSSFVITGALGDCCNDFQYLYSIYTLCEESSAGQRIEKVSLLSEKFKRGESQAVSERALRCSVSTRDNEVKILMAFIVNS